MNKNSGSATNFPFLKSGRNENRSAVIHKNGYVRIRVFFMPSYSLLPLNPYLTLQPSCLFPVTISALDIVFGLSMPRSM
jgi:hypothetical protein